MIMARKLTARQREALLETYIAGEDGWTPFDGDRWDGGRIEATARKLCADGYLAVFAGTAGTYVMTEAGRARLGLGPVAPVHPIRKAIGQALSELGMDPDGWKVLTGRQLPVLTLDAGKADFRGCRFALDPREPVGADMRRFLGAMGSDLDDEDTRWEAVARRVSEMGFPVYPESSRTVDLIGFWPPED
jgi:hypothetical protein